MQPNSDQRGLQVPGSRGSIASHTNRQAAADLARHQVHAVYDAPQPNEQAAAASQTPDPAASANPYAQTHDNNTDIQAEQQNAAIQEHWQKYHSAWQQYYQMYYERYYQQEVQKHAAETVVQAPAEPAKKSSRHHDDNTVSKDEAVDELRNELLTKVREQTAKIRKSRHFMPAVVAGIAALSVVFLQWNQIIVANVMAYTTPASLETNSSFIDPNSSTDVAVGPEPLLIIPKLAVKAPVIYDLNVSNTSNEGLVETKLQSGVVHYPIVGAEAVPGQVGNVVLLGHSANDVFVPGDYKFIFLRLEQLQKGDQFYLNYQSKRYTYVVSEKRVISPNQVSQLAINNGKPLATLVTCVPVGTSQNRLMVIAEQVAPDPAKATPQTQTASNAPQQEIGGGTKNFFERLFGGN